MDVIKTASLCLRARFSSGPDREILDYLFADSRTPAFALYLRRVLPGRNASLLKIERSLSRKNGFVEDLQGEFDEETEDWVFIVPEESLFLQADNCRDCGGYISSNTVEMSIYHRASCNCP